MYFCLLMAAVANPSYFNAFHLVLLMTVFHKTWQLLTCLFLLEIYHLHLPTIYTDTHTSLDPSLKAQKMPQTHSYTLFCIYSSVPAIKTPADSSQHSHLTCFVSFHHPSDFCLTIINVFPILFVVDVKFTVSS